MNWDASRETGRKVYGCVYQTLRQQRYESRKAERARIAAPLLGENDGV
jgi:hypothetical protein